VPGVAILDHPAGDKPALAGTPAASGALVAGREQQRLKDPRRLDVERVIAGTGLGRRRIVGIADGNIAHPPTVTKKPRAACGV